MLYKEDLKSKMSLDDLEVFFRELAYHGVEHSDITFLRKEDSFKWMTLVSRLISLSGLAPDDVFSEIYYNIFGRVGMDYGHIKFLLRSEGWQITGAVEAKEIIELTKPIVRSFSISAYRKIGNSPEKLFHITVGALNLGMKDMGLFKKVSISLKERRAGERKKYNAGENELIDALMRPALFFEKK